MASSRRNSLDSGNVQDTGSTSKNMRQDKKVRDFCKEQSKQNLLQEIDQVERIEHATKKPSTISKLKGSVWERFDGKPYTFQPDRVNRQIDKMQTTLVELRRETNENFRSLPAELGNSFIETLKAVVQPFPKSCEGARHRYGETDSIFYSNQRLTHERNLEKINAILSHMAEDLGAWSQYRTVRREMKDRIGTPEFLNSLVDDLSPPANELDRHVDLGVKGGIEVNQETLDAMKALDAMREALKNDLGKVKESYAKVLEGYRNGEAEPSERKKFQKLVDPEHLKRCLAWQHPDVQGYIGDLNNLPVGTSEWTKEINNVYLALELNLDAYYNPKSGTITDLANFTKNWNKNGKKLCRILEAVGPSNYAAAQEARAFEFPKELDIESLEQGLTLDLVAKRVKSRGGHWNIMEQILATPL